jgi:hypothetical protein
VDPTGITLSKQSDLAFGSIIASGSAGTVTMAAGPSGTRSSTGGVSAGSFGAAATAACFKATGALNAGYVIMLPASATLTGPGTSMTVDSFISSPASPGTLSATGAQDLYVGATVHVGSSQTQGSYSGTFSVTVMYN